MGQVGNPETSVSTHFKMCDNPENERTHKVTCFNLTPFWNKNSLKYSPLPTKIKLVPTAWRNRTSAQIFRSNICIIVRQFAKFCFTKHKKITWCFLFSVYFMLSGFPVLNLDAFGISTGLRASDEPVTYVVYKASFFLTFHPWLRFL